MRIVAIVSNHCDPDPRVEKEAAALARAGHDVTVIAWDRAGASAEREIREGFTIERIGPRAPYGGGVRSLPLFRDFWKGATARAVELAPRVVQSHDTDAIPAGRAAVERLRSLGNEVRYVVDFHELYRASRMVPQKGLVGVVARAYVDHLERGAIQAADAVLVANPGTLAHYDAMGAVGKSVLIANAPDAELFRPMECDQAERPFTVTFIGRKRYAATLEALAEAIQPYDDMRVVLAGSGPDAEQVDALAARFARVSAEGHVPYAQIPARYACTDVVHAAYDTLVGNVLHTIPGKVLEAMACARPVIVSRGTWVETFVAEHGVGLAVDATDAASVGEALVWLRDHPAERAEMGARGRAVVESELNWAQTERRLAEAFSALG